MTSRGRGTPVSTHRLQLQPEFTLDDAVAQLDYLAALGVSHIYLSPILQASAGSMHGYDVVDHTRVAADLGGEAAFARLAAAARAAGLGIVVDVVPNHMTVPTPLHLNAPLWSVLRAGRGSPYAHWFDIDWDAQDGKVLLPVLGASVDEVLAAGELTLDRTGGEDVVRYYDQVFPVAPDSNSRGMPLSSLLESQHYRLASWRTGGTDLNYRRFFDVTSLIAVRVEDADVFEATHALLTDEVHRGAIDGLRIDHPDGLADPEGYLRQLAEATGGAWVVVEKILEGREQLPPTWACAGTTGYDSLLRVGGLFVDPAGAGPLTALSDELLGEHQDLDEMIRDAKGFVVEHVLVAEVERLMRSLTRALPDLDPVAARRHLEAMLVAMDRYRIYVRPGAVDADRLLELDSVALDARAHDPDLDPAVLEQIIGLAAGQPVAGDDAAQADFVVRFQQTCGPVMAKGVEDTTFYRYVRLTGLNEVGGDPGSVGFPVDDFHRYAGLLVELWPGAMTTLSTHDTKRSEDVRARLALLAERPDQWATWVRRARTLVAGHRSELIDPLTEYLLLQTVVGAWPIDVERLGGYATKAIREAKLHTTWTEPDAPYEAAIQRYVEQILTDERLTAHVEHWHAATAAETRANVLGQKIVQLTMPGVPDVYQGTDLVDLSLVDPDNRRLVDYGERRRRLARLDAGESPADLSDEKLLVTSAALRLRAEVPTAFVGPDAAHQGLPTDSDHVVAFARGPQDRPLVVTLATRLAGRLRDLGGWGRSTVELPTGRWRDRLSGKEVDGGSRHLAEVLAADGLPVAMFVRVDAGTTEGGAE